MHGWRTCKTHGGRVMMLHACCSLLQDLRCMVASQRSILGLRTVQEPVMGGAVDSSNGGSQPVHLTNRTSNANKQPPIAGAISFGEAKAALPRLPIACSFYAFSFPIFSFLVEAARASDLTSASVEFRGV